MLVHACSRVSSTRKSSGSFYTKIGVLSLGEGNATRFVVFVRRGNVPRLSAMRREKCTKFAILSLEEEVYQLASLWSIRRDKCTKTIVVH